MSGQARHGGALRVRIHLNLGQPARAETAVRVQGASGAWACVGYATELALAHCRPVVDSGLADRVAAGALKKVPHAFLEGDLTHFVGRVRALAPLALVGRARAHLVPGQPGAHTGQRVNYNPRFARCFYLEVPDKAAIEERLVGCERLSVRGWDFLAQGVETVPLAASDRRDADAMALTSDFERAALRRGRAAMGRRGV